MTDEPYDDQRHECNECGWTGIADQLDEIDPDDAVPTPLCPACGSADVPAVEVDDDGSS